MDDQSPPDGRVPARKFIEQTFGVLKRTFTHNTSFADKTISRAQGYFKHGYWDRGAEMVLQAGAMAAHETGGKRFAIIASIDQNISRENWRGVLLNARQENIEKLNSQLMGRAKRKFVLVADEVKELVNAGLVKMPDQKRKQLLTDIISSYDGELKRVRATAVEANPEPVQTVLSQKRAKERQARQRAIRRAQSRAVSGDTANPTG